MSSSMSGPGAVAAILLAAAAAPRASSLDDRVDTLFAAWDREGSPGAAVAVVKDGDVVVADGYGNAQIEYGVPITPETVFHVASVSKQFTAFAICLLAKEGKLSLDDPVRRYVPEVPDFGPEITLDHLLHHTSGLRDQWETLAIAGWRLDDVITTEQILTMVAHQRELNFPPGERYMYCNTGYTLLAEVVARVSGESFPDFCREHVFEPLGMTRTRFHDDPAEVVPDRAYSYQPDGDGFRNAVLSYANAGATSLFTTVLDLCAWLENFETGRVGGPEVQEMMRRRYVLNDGTRGDYALGLSIGRRAGHRMISHSGGDAGFRSFVAWYPDQHLGVAVLANLGSIAPDRLANAVAGLYLEEPPSEPAQTPAAATVTIGGAGASGAAPSEPEGPPGPLADYAGRYWSEELGTFYDVAVEGEALVARHRRHGTIHLSPAGGDAFRGDRWFFGRAEFQRDAEGAVVAFRLQGSRVLNLFFGRTGAPGR